MGIMNAKNYAKHKLGDKVKIKTNTGPEGAKQENREECDINCIVARFNATGIMPVNMQTLQPTFADVSEIGDYASALRRINSASEAFSALPAEMRSRFGNNAVNLVEFLQDSKNYDEAVKLGLVAKKAEPVVPAAPVLPAPATTPPAPAKA